MRNRERTKRAARKFGHRYNYLEASARRALLVREARKVFAAKGFQGATIAEICEAAGVAAGTIYLHFKDKKELYRAVIYDAVDRVQELLSPEEAVSAAKSGEFSLERFVEQRINKVLAAVSEEADSFRLLLRGEGLDEELSELLTRFNSVIISRIETEIRLAMQAGLIRKVDPRLAALMVAGAILAYMVSWLSGPSASSENEAAKELTRLLLHGLAAKD